jgi:hypothetical protein
LLDCANEKVMAADTPINIIAIPQAKRMFLVFMVVLCLFAVFKMV